jgi:hypothetical protein
MKSISISWGRKSISFSLIYLLSYWERKTEYTPESRLETHESVKKKRERESKEFVLKKHQNHFIDFAFFQRTKSEPKPVRQYIGDDGRPLNCNEPK